MFKLFNKVCLSALLALLSLSSANSSLLAWDSCCDPCFDPCASNKFYIGGFGGGLYSNSTRIIQQGTAFFTEAEGGPLAVFAQGHTKKNSAGFGGAQIGYRLSQSALTIGCTDWSITPAAELEAFFYNHTKRGHLINPTDRLPEHDFLDSFRMNMSVLLINAVFSLDNPCFRGFSPYIGGGIGATHICVRKANSLQVSPEEAGINHFNSLRSDTSWAFAAQAKAGVRYKICDSVSIFGEYRYLYVDSSKYVLGSTVYPTHAPTSPWNVKVKDIQYNAFAIGIQYEL